MPQPVAQARPGPRAARSKVAMIKGPFKLSSIYSGCRQNILLRNRNPVHGSRLRLRSGMLWDASADKVPSVFPGSPVRNLNPEPRPPEPFPLNQAQRTRNPKPSLPPQPSTTNQEPRTKNQEPSTKHNEPRTRNQEPSLTPLRRHAAPVGWRATRSGGCTACSARRSQWFSSGFRNRRAHGRS